MILRLAHRCVFESYFPKYLHKAHFWESHHHCHYSCFNQLYPYKTFDFQSLRRSACLLNTIKRHTTGAYLSNSYSEGNIPDHKPTRNVSSPTVSVDYSETVTPLMRQLSACIRATGPITVANFMREVLANPVDGYYTCHSGIGSDGDFITAPELTPIFGELIGVWLLHEWQRLGASANPQLIELGPGRGSLMSDILDVWQRFLPNISPQVRLVENSVQMVSAQIKALDVQQLNIPADKINNTFTDGKYDDDVVDVCSQLRGVTRHGYPIAWYSRLADVPSTCPSTSASDHCTTLLVANEFLDTMPTHQFRKTEQGWREVMVDVEPDDPLKFRFVLSSGSTPSMVLLKAMDDVAVSRSQLEVSPQCLLWLDEIASKISAGNSAALLIDYGPATIENRRDTPCENSTGTSAHLNISTAPQAAEDSLDGECRESSKNKTTGACAGSVEKESDSQTDRGTITGDSNCEAASGHSEVREETRTGVTTSETRTGVEATAETRTGVETTAVTTFTGDTLESGDSLRAFRGHRCVHPLHHALGTADITCDVDFDQMKYRLNSWRQSGHGEVRVSPLGDSPIRGGGGDLDTPDTGDRCDVGSSGDRGDLGTSGAGSGGDLGTSGAGDGGDLGTSGAGGRGDSGTSGAGGRRDLGTSDADSGVFTIGPVTQGDFLNAMGLQYRLQGVVESEPEKLPELQALYRMLTVDMGHRFKVMAVYSSRAKRLVESSPSPGF